MAKQLQIRGGTTVQHSTFTGALREITIDTDKDVVVVHDGTTVGGFPLAKQTSVDSKVTKVTSTDNAIVRFNGITGQVQNSGVLIDDNNNVGIGVTPSAWQSGIKAFDLGNAFIHYGGGTNFVMGVNAYANAGYKYKSAGYASNYTQQEGTHYWFTAPSGTAGNAITWTTAMTLDASGKFLLGTTSAGSWGTNCFGVETGNGFTVTGHIAGTASDTAYAYFDYNNSVVGSITQSGTTAIAYNTTSDYRLKENIRPSDCKRFMDIKFVDYERIDGRHECGVIAHELQEVYPDLVTGEKDATEIRKVELTPAVGEVKDEDGNIIVEAVEAVYEEQEFPVYQQVNYMGLIARIGTVVQQQAKLIEELRLEVEILKRAK